MDRHLLLSIFILELVLCVHAKKCPMPWFGFGSNSNSCYYFRDQFRKSWADADYYCKAMDGELLKIDDKDEELWIMQVLDTLNKVTSGEQEWWTALKRDPNDINNWIWADNTTVNTDLIRWGQGEPNNYRNNENCAEIWSGTFNDKSCSMKLDYICERSKDVPEKCDSSFGWEYHSGKCYKLFDTPVTRDQATSICTRNQAEMVSITSAIEQEAMSIMAKLKSIDIWLSRVYLPTQMAWMIVSSPGSETPSNLFYWQDGEPDIYQGVQNCAALNFTGEIENNWYADNCTELKSFACQKMAGICPPGFVQFQRRCYLIKQSRRTSWQGAKQYCENINASLLEIQSYLEDEFIRNYIKQQRQSNLAKVWIGLVPKGDVPSEGTQNFRDWLWTSKDGYFTVSYLNLGSVMPNSCAYLDAGFGNKWFYNMPCNTSLPFVCYQYTSASNETRTPIRKTIATVAPLTSTRSQTINGTSGTNRTSSFVTSGMAKTTKPASTLQAITTTSKPVTWDPQCGMYWDKDPNSDTCYIVYNKPSTWDEAKKFCQNMKGDLISVTLIEEQFYLAGRLRQFSDVVDKIWIGAHSRDAEGGWQWSDGSAFAFFNFLKGESISLDQSKQCVAMGTRYSKWSAELCSSKHAVGCKKLINKTKMPNIPPTSPPFTKGNEFFGCENGWSEYKLSCYLVVRNKTNWNEANSYCKSIGGELSSIGSEAERDFILSQLPKSNCYNLFKSDDKCDEWESIGECDRNPVWMAKNCQKSCQSCIRDCRDVYSEPECQHWASLGECGSNPKWMLKNCALSCGICDAAIYGGFWIGLTDVKREMWFTWSDGSDVTFTAWAKSQPNSNTNGEDCVTIGLKDGRWSDYYCTEYMPGFVCKTGKKVLPKATKSPLSIGCENGSVGYNALCYGFYGEKLSWSDAETYCTDGNGHLATINDRYVQAFLASQLVAAKGSYWIGLTQSYDTGLTDQWQDGQAVLFTHWSKDHTGTIEEDGFCVAMATTHPIGLWNTVNCTNLNSFICEYPRIGFTTMSTTTKASTTTEPLKCSPGWKEYGPYCYKKFDEKKSWLDARSSCGQIGADLVSIHSWDEEQFLFGTYAINARSFWIGFSDRDIEGGFKWSDGTPTDFTNWNAGEPNDAFYNEDCAYMESWSDIWNDDNCFRSQSYVCKVPKGLPVFEQNITTESPVSCGGDGSWLYMREKCYKFDFEKKSRTWYEARNVCMSLGGDLPSFHAEDEINFLVQQTSKNSVPMFWIGLNDLKHTGFEWTDQTPVNMVAWGSNEPQISTSNKKCVKQNPDSGRWYTDICTYKFEGLVCSRNNGSTSPVTMATTTVTSGGCPDGFTGLFSSNKCFKAVNKLSTWNGAVKACNAYARGCHLATVDSDVENAFILTLVESLKANPWIGLHKTGSQRIYSWQDNSKVSFTNWAEGEPNGFNELCVEFYRQPSQAGKWNDMTCWSQRPYVCQTSRNEHFATPTPSPDCPSGFHKYGCSCYKIQTTKMDWDTAQSTCKIDSSNLVSISDAYEQAFIDVFSNNISGSFWIGLNAKNSDDLAWVDGWPYVYSRWADNEPSSQPDEKCSLIQNRKWKDTGCENKLQSICEKSLVNVPTTPVPGYCPKGYSNFMGYCYFVEINNLKSWIQAQADCTSKNMNLVSISNEAELEHIRNLVTQASAQNGPVKIFIGLTRRIKSDGTLPLDFYWIDGTPFDFTSWNFGEPSDPLNSDYEQCTEMYPRGRWNDVNCYDIARAYVCKSPESPGTTNAQVTMETTESKYETTDSVSPTETKRETSPNDSNLSTKSNIEATTKSTFKPSNPFFPRRQSPRITKMNTNEDRSLTAGQVVGICLGVIIVISIFGVIGFLLWTRKKGAAYSSDKGNRGFTNAMYMKSADNVSISERT